MRNLKKILALVLALVMSLSLMATASAAETSTAAGNYEVAVKVLTGLDVVRGDEGGIREADPITRAEVAALAYRIHTADVNDTQANLYYDLQEAAFTDLAPVSAWALGYIGYAHNAQIVKGNGDGTFNPTGNITGYEVLAMALRAIGYGKNGEFEGAEWQINTAAWARREGLLDGVTPSDQVSLDKPASRGMVFQILFNTIQHTDVQFSYVTGDLYINASGEKNTMALRLGLEKITGVVMANEWADLRDGTVMKDGWSCLRVGDKDYDIDYATELEDIGESRLAYIHGSEVLHLANSDLNTVRDNNGEETTVDSLKSGLTVNETTQHFTNFDEGTKDYSDWLIRYVVDVTAGSSTGLTASELSFLAKNAAPKGTATDPLEYTRTIKPDEKIESEDLSIMKKIFYTANRVGLNLGDSVTNWVDGEVYVGTSSLTDQSDIKSWNEFVETYLKDDKTRPITKAGNGEWLKIIDNDDDGVAEYVLLTQYVLDKVVDSITKNGDTTYYYGVDITGYTLKSHTGYEPKVGDIVLYAIIDDTVQMQLADSEKATFKAVNYKERQATPTEGEPYEQSDIDNQTKLPDVLVEVDENIEYTLYLDKYGYVRAYDNKTTYALVTEVYPTDNMNQAWVTDRRLTAEVMLEGEKTIKEYNLLNNWYANGYNPFYTATSWDGGRNSVERKNWLQPATHSLDWDWTIQEGETVFDYGRVNITDKTTNHWETAEHSWTNVAKYTLGENGINLYTAAEYSSNGIVREDYVQLALTETVSGKNPLYAIADADYTNQTSNPNNHYVRAVDNTLFFVVAREDGIVKQYTGYENIPTLTEAANDIHAMYAVASNSRTDADVNNYWTADVIVIEIERFDSAYESIALIYSNDYKVSGDVKYLQVLDSAKGAIGIIPNNYDIWRNQFNAYGFYGVRNIDATSTDGIYTADIYPIGSEYNSYGIFFGRVRSTDEELDRSTYITVDVMGNEVIYENSLDANGNVVVTQRLDVETTTTIRLAKDYGAAWSIDAKTNYNEANELIVGTHGSNRVEHGDYIIWVEIPGTSSHTNASVGYIVDLSDKATSNHSWANPAWLCSYDSVSHNFSSARSIAKVIAGEQNTPSAGVTDPLKTQKDQAIIDIDKALEVLTDEQRAAISDIVTQAKEDVRSALTVDEINAAVASVTKAVEDILAGGAEEDVKKAKDEVAGAVEDAQSKLDAALADGRLDQDAFDTLKEALGKIDVEEITEDNLDTKPGELLDAIKDILNQIPAEEEPETLNVKATYTIKDTTTVLAEDTWENVTVEDDGTIRLSVSVVEKWNYAPGYTVKFNGVEAEKDETSGYYIIDVSGVTDKEIEISIEVTGSAIPLSASQGTRRIDSARVLSAGAADDADGEYTELEGRFVIAKGLRPDGETTTVDPNPDGLVIEWDKAEKVETIGENFVIWSVPGKILTSVRQQLLDGNVTEIKVFLNTVKDESTVPVEIVVTVDGEVSTEDWGKYVTISVGGTDVTTLSAAEIGETISVTEVEELPEGVASIVADVNGGESYTVAEGDEKVTITVTVTSEEGGDDEVSVTVRTSGNVIVQNDEGTFGTIWSAKTTTGKITVVAKMTSSTTSQRPVVELGEDNVVEFTANAEDGTWTAEIPVDAGTGAITVKLVTYYTVKVEGVDSLTKQSITVDKPEQAIYANGTAVFQITVPSGKVPEVDVAVDADSGNSLVKSADNVWTLTLTKISTAATVKVKLADARDIIIADGGNVTVVGEKNITGWQSDTYTVVVDATDGYQPYTGTTGNETWFAIAEDQGNVEDGSTRWELDVELGLGVNRISVSGKEQYRLTVTAVSGNSKLSVPAAFATAGKANTAYIVLSDGDVKSTAVIKGVSVLKGYTVKSNDLSGATLTGKNTEVEGTLENSTLWDLTWENATAATNNVSFTLDTSDGVKMTLVSQDSSITVVDGPSKYVDRSETYYDGSDTVTVEYASFKLEVAEGKMPELVGTNNYVRFTPNEDGTWTADIMKDATYNNVQISAIDIPFASINSGYNVGIDLSGVNKAGNMELAVAKNRTNTDDPTKKVVWQWDDDTNNTCPIICTYVFEGIKINMPDGSDAMPEVSVTATAGVNEGGTEVFVKSTSSALNDGTWTLSPDYVGAPKYSITVVTTDNIGDITVTLKAKTGEAVTLSISSEDAKKVTVEESPLYSNEGAPVTFKVKLSDEEFAAGSSISVVKPSGSAATVTTKDNGDGTFDVTVSGAKEETTLTLSVVSGDTFIYEVGPAADHTGVRQVVSASEDDNGRSTGTIVLRVQLENNYVLPDDISGLVTLTVLNAGFNGTLTKDDANGYTVGTYTKEHIGGTTWEITIPDIKAQGTGAIGKVEVTVGNVSDKILTAHSGGSYVWAEDGSSAIDSDAATGITATLPVSVSEKETDAYAALDVTVEASDTAIEPDANEYKVLFAVKVTTTDWVIEEIDTGIDGVTAKAEATSSQDGYIITITIDENGTYDGNSPISVTEEEGGPVVKIIRDLELSLVFVKAE